ncbi:MAG: exodeoxyribonuclease VII large subunit [bacterium]
MQNHRYILTVSELNAEASLFLAQGFPLIWLEGELSNLVRPASGHWYFSLKDHSAYIRCALFRNHNRHSRLQPYNGQHVLVRGRIALYEPRGEFQFVVEHIEAAGEGLLLREYEALKTRLTQAGLLDESRKRNLPSHPRHIGIISALQGAALQDILHILARRSPHIPVTLYPVTVQGEQAAPTIISAIQQAQEQPAEHRCDVLLLARGGGSMEDLWAFNDENLAYAIADCTIPIMTGIGHEIDFTMVDLVADQRAPTPSAAAELVSPDHDELGQQLAHLQARLLAAWRNNATQAQQVLERISNQLQKNHPEQRLFHQQLRLAQQQRRLFDTIKQHLHQQQATLHTHTHRLSQQSPDAHYTQQQANLARAYQQLCQAMKIRLTIEQQRLYVHSAQLQSVSPLATLGRGYTLTQTVTKQTLSSVKQVKQGDTLITRFADGDVTSVIL